MLVFSQRFLLRDFVQQTTNILKKVKVWTFGRFLAEVIIKTNNDEKNPTPNIISQLQLMKRHTRSIHPLFPCGRRIRMNVHSFGKFWISFAGHHPP